MKQPPIYLMVGTDLSKGRISIKTLYNLSISLNNKFIQNQFIAIPHDYSTSESERAAFEVLSQNKSGDDSFLSDFKSMKKSVEKLYDTLSILSKHISSIIEGKVPEDYELGNFVGLILSQLPSSEISFDKMFNNSVMDTLMTIYLVNTTK